MKNNFVEFTVYPRVLDIKEGVDCLLILENYKDKMFNEQKIEALIYTWTGQGYANKRKNAAISRYLRLRRKGSKNSQLQDQLQHGVNHDDVAKDEDSPGSNRVGSQVKPFSAKGRKEANPSPGVKEDVLKDPKDWKVLPTKRYAKQTPPKRKENESHKITY